MKRDRALELAAGPEAALAAYRRAFAGLGWEILEEDEARLVAMEVPFRLNCLTRPSVVEVQVRSSSPGKTVVALEGSANGIGAAGAGRLEAHLATLQRRAAALVS